MRTTKKLLQIMLDNTDCFKDGLCNWVSKLYFKDIITLEERRFLTKYISSNKPFLLGNFYRFFSWLARCEAYYWEPHKIKPRIKWIKKHIKINS